MNACLKQNIKFIFCGKNNYSYLGWAAVYDENGKSYEKT